MILGMRSPLVSQGASPRPPGRGATTLPCLLGQQTMCTNCTCAPSGPVLGLLRHHRASLCTYTCMRAQNSVQHESSQHAFQEWAKLGNMTSLISHAQSREPYLNMVFTELILAQGWR
jgi:hypothetical protein